MSDLITSSAPSSKRLSTTTFNMKHCPTPGATPRKDLSYFVMANHSPSLETLILLCATSGLMIAWLGEEHQSDAGAMNYDDPKPLSHQASEEQKMVKVLGLLARFSGTLMSAMNLIKRPWFSRAWIIQEVALTARLYVQCGKTIIDWENLYANLSLLLDGVVDGRGAQITFNNSYFDRLQFIESTRSSISTTKSGNIAAPLNNTRVTGTQEITPNSRSSWEQLHCGVVNARSYGASDPRDHIFTLLGLVEEANARVIPVDYSVSHTMLFRDFVRQFIQQTGNLSALG
ncbi:MAG: hypothetical protein Q9209_007111 [Squamulea sp. 1 TL-2023]